jgi:hypothetical protein
MDGKFSWRCGKSFRIRSLELSKYCFNSSSRRALELFSFSRKEFDEEMVLFLGETGEIFVEIVFVSRR